MYTETQARLAIAAELEDLAYQVRRGILTAGDTRTMLNAIAASPGLATWQDKQDERIQDYIARGLV